MAALKLDVIPDLRRFKKSVQEIIGGGGGRLGGGGGKGDAEGKKQTSALGRIAKGVGLLAFLSNLKPITDLLSVISGFVVLGFLQIAKLAKWLTGPEVYKTITDALEDLWDTVVDLKDSFIANLETGWNYIKELPAKIWEYMTELPGKIWEYAKELPAMIWDYVKDLSGSLWNLMKDGFNWVTEGLGGIASSIWEYVKELPAQIWGYMTELPGQIWDALQVGFTWIKDVATNVWDAIKALPAQIWDFMTKLPSLIASAIKKVGGVIGSFFGGGSSTTVGDAILRPNGDIVKTSPMDTIIATKTPGLLGAAGAGGGSVTNNFYGVTPQQVVDMFFEQMGTQALRRTRL